MAFGVSSFTSKEFSFSELQFGSVLRMLKDPSSFCAASQVSFSLSLSVQLAQAASSMRLVKLITQDGLNGKGGTMLTSESESHTRAGSR